MILMLILGLSTLGRLSAAATIPQPALLTDKTITPGIAALNLTLSGDKTLQMLNFSLEAGQDPRFSVYAEKGDDDLSPRSTYMSALNMLEDLAKLPFNHHFHGGSWSGPGFEDVAISIPPQQRLQVNLSMWGLYQAVVYVIQHNFCSVALHMFYTSARSTAVLDDVGIIYIYEPEAVSTSIVPGSRVSYHATQNLTVNSSDSSNDISIRGNYITSLSNSRYSLHTELTGARLNKDGVFLSIIECINEVASWDRIHPLKGSKEVSWRAKGVKFAFKPWGDPAAPPRLEYKPLMFMLFAVPKYMDRNNKFQTGSFVLEIDGQPVGLGYIEPIRDTAAA